MRNFTAELRSLDERYYHMAASKIAEMLAIMGIHEGEEYVFPTRRAGYGFCDSVRSISYYWQNEDVALRYEWVPGLRDSKEERKGGMACSMSQYFWYYFLKYVKNNPVVPKKYTRKHVNLDSHYQHEKSLLENAAAAEIIQMMAHMGIQQGRYLLLPAHDKIKSFEDSIVAIEYYDGGPRINGSEYLIDGEAYAIRYKYYEDSPLGLNVAEVNGDMIFDLHRRIKLVYRNFIKTRPESYIGFFGKSYNRLIGFAQSTPGNIRATALMELLSQDSITLGH